jgi:hypothetical protein
MAALRASPSSPKTWRRLDAEDLSSIVEKPRELAAPDSHDPRAGTAIEDEVYAGVGQECHPLGRDAPEIPVHGPVVLDELLEVRGWVIADVAGTLRVDGRLVQHPPRRIDLSPDHRALSHSFNTAGLSRRIMLQS